MSTIDINQLLGSIQNGNNPTNNNDDSDNQLLTMLLELLTQLLNNQNNPTQNSNYNNYGNQDYGEQDSIDTSHYFDNDVNFSQSNNSNYKLIIDTIQSPYPDPDYSYNHNQPTTYSDIKVARAHDISNDGYINNDDLSMMKDFIKGKIDFTDKQKKAADFDNNGKVNQADINILTERLKERVKGDVNGDGRVNEQDLQIVEDFTFGGDKVYSEGQPFLTVAEMAAISTGIGPIGPGSYDFTALKKLIDSREKGDINGDGKINQADLDVLNKLDDMHILSDSQIDAADFDGDGTYDKDKDTPLLKELVDKNKTTVKPPKKKKKKH